MNYTDQEAIERVLAGNPDDYRILMDRHLPAVLRLTFRVTGSLEDAEEAAQEAFLRAYKKLATFREQSAFPTWVYRIAMNCALNLVKRRSRSLAWSPAQSSSAHVSDDLFVSPRPTPEASLLADEARQHQDQILECLTPMERSAFVLRHFEDQPVDVIATALNVSTNTARQTIFRAASKLRRQLAPSRQAMYLAQPSSGSHDEFFPLQLRRFDNRDRSDCLLFRRAFRAATLRNRESSPLVARPGG